MGIDLHKNEFQERIDSYLSNMMDNVELSAFMEELKTDPELFKSVQLEKMIADEIVERNSFMEILEKNSKHGKEKHTVSRKIYWTIGIAASLAIGVYIVTQPAKLSEEEYNTIASANIINPPIRYGSSDVIQYRGVEKDANSKITKAIELYEDRDFESAKTAFEDALKDAKTNQDLAFFMSVSELFSNDIESAITNLHYLSELKDYKYKEDATFYLALAYIKDDQSFAAGKILWNIKRGGGKYAEQADQILDKMWWFY